MNTENNPTAPNARVAGPAVTRHIAVDHHSGAPLAPDDPRVGYLRAAQTAQAVISSITTEEGDLPTPCHGWSVNDLVRHLLGVYIRVADAPSGAAMDGEPATPDIALADAPAFIETELQRTHASWADDATLAMTLDAPWGPSPAAMCLGIWTSEMLAHSWDLAVSVGATVEWPEPDASIAAEMTKAGIPAERGEDFPFDDVVSLPDDAAPIERLVAWIGRNPAAPIQP